MNQPPSLPEALQDKLDAIHGICRVIFDYPELIEGLDRLMTDYSKEYKEYTE